MKPPVFRTHSINLVVILTAFSQVALLGCGGMPSNLMQSAPSSQSQSSAMARSGVSPGVIIAKPTSQTSSANKTDGQTRSRILKSPPSTISSDGGKSNRPSSQRSPQMATIMSREWDGPATQQQCTKDIQLTFSRPGRPSRNLPLNFMANPQTIAAGQVATLSWSSQNSTSVTIDHGLGTFGPSGNVDVSPQETTVYTATASGPGGSATQILTISVGVSNTTIATAAVPQTINSGQSATLSWSTTNASSVTIDHGIGTVALNGSISVSPTATSNYVFTVGCGGTAGGVTTEVAVAVQNAINGISAVNHIIYMLQENRSFDHYFGKLNDYRVSLGLPAIVDGLPTNAVNFATDGTAVPAFKLQTECIEEMTAAWNESHWDFNLNNPTSTDPKMDGYVAIAQGYAKFNNELDTAGKRAMGYYDSSDLPYYYFMATNFATSDRWFSPAPSLSAVNRLYAFAATSAGYTKPPTKTLTTPTIFQLLDQAGVSWKIYYSDTDSAGNPLTGLNTFFDYAQMHRPQIVPVNPTYFNDLQSGTLPSVAFIEHGSQSGRDEHPGGSNIQVGAQYISTIINGLMSSTSWKDSVFILSYDEAGGAFDHVPAMTGVPNPDGIAPIDLASGDISGDFTRTGFRVPLLVISPFTVKHFVSHSPMDYTAILKFIEKRFGLANLNARDAAQPDMTEFFDFLHPSWMIPPTPPAQGLTGACYLDHLP